MARRKRYTFYAGGRRPRRGRSPLLTALLALAVAALVFIGWNIYTPLKKLMTEGPSVSSSQPASSRTASSKAASAASSAASSETAQSTSAVHGIYLSSSTLTADGISQTLATAKSAGINVAVADVKSDDGVLHYASKLSEVQDKGLVADGAMDGAAIATAITQAGMTPAARISCFKDPLAPTVMRDGAVKYMDKSQTWLDLSGNRWLNPYADTATQYLTDVATELVSMGFKQIYLDNVAFPSGSLAKAWFGDNVGSKENALQTFVTNLEQKVKAAGGTVTIILPADAATGGGQAAVGQDQDPYGYGADAVAPLLTPAAMNGLTVGGQALANTSGSLSTTLTSVAAALKTQNAAKYSTAVPLIQAGTAGDTSVAAADVSAQIAALSAAGIGNYVLYAETGYELSGVSASSSASSK